MKKQSARKYPRSQTPVPPTAHLSPEALGVVTAFGGQGQGLRRGEGGEIVKNDALATVTIKSGHKATLSPWGEEGYRVDSGTDSVLCDDLAALVECLYLLCPRTEDGDELYSYIKPIALRRALRAMRERKSH